MTFKILFSPKPVVCWGLIWTLSIHVLADEPASSTPEDAQANAVWDQAVSFQSASQHAEAAQAFVAFVERAPDDPRARQAKVRAALCLTQVERPADAIALLDEAIRDGVQDYWLQAALFHKAEACLATDKGTEALQAMQALRAQFPEAPLAARCTVLEAKARGEDPAQADAAYQWELEAAEVYSEAMTALKQGNTEEGWELLGQVMTYYPDTGAALRAYDTAGHLCYKEGRREDAGVYFVAIVDQLRDKAPSSRLLQTARARLGALYHSHGQRAEALAMYQDMLRTGAGKLSSNAALQIAGLSFELLHRKFYEREPISDQEWDQLRVICSAVKETEGATDAQKARADLLAIETLCWQKRHADAVDAADEFLTHYSGDSLKRDIATVRFFAGEAAQTIGQYDKALEHFRWIVSAYPDEDEIWSRMDHLPRTYFRIWETLRNTQAPAEQTAAAADALLNRFPESSYAKHVRITTRQDEKWKEWRAQVLGQAQE